MKKFAIASILSFGMLTGCIHQPVSAPLPAGAINATDASLNEVLQAGHAAAVQYGTDVANGFVPSPALKTAMAALISALNIADPLYQSYHNLLQTQPGAGEPAALASAVVQVSQALATITASK